MVENNLVELSLGDLSDGGTPGNIPNPAVKSVSADGTWRATSWESRSLPRGFSFNRTRAGFFIRACVVVNRQFFIFMQKVGEFHGFSKFTQW